MWFRKAISFHIGHYIIYFLEAIKTEPLGAKPWNDIFYRPDNIGIYVGYKNNMLQIDYFLVPSQGQRVNKCKVG